MARLRTATLSPMGTPIAPKKPKPKAPPAAPPPKQGSLDDEWKKERARQEKKDREQRNKNSRQSAISDLSRLNAELEAQKAKRRVNNSSLEALQALVGGGLERGLNSNLSSIDGNLRTKLDALSETFTSAMGEYSTNLRDNEASEADATFSNLTNRSRERGDLLSQALSQGAGESDVLKSQQQALRNWSANQGEVNRSFFDTRASVNAGISDLNSSIRTNMINEEAGANASRGAVWDDYFSAMAGTYTDMAQLEANNYLSRKEADELKKQRQHAKDMIDWIDSGKDAADWKPPTTMGLKGGNDYYNPYDALAGDYGSMTWDDPGVSGSTLAWQGGSQSTGGLNTASRAGLPNTGTAKRPEGATLRRW